MNPTCPIHNEVSKVRKGRYGDFFSCPHIERDEQGGPIYCPHKFPQKPSGEATFVKTLDDSTRDRSIKWLNSVNNVCLLIANNKLDLTQDNWANDVRAYAEQLFRLQPPA